MASFTEIPMEVSVQNCEGYKMTDRAATCAVGGIKHGLYPADELYRCPGCERYVCPECHHGEYCDECAEARVETECDKRECQRRM